MSSKIDNVTDATFDSEVRKSEKPVLVDFWAPWCGPCRMVTPILEELSDQYSGKIKIVKVNVDDNPRIAAEMGIRSIPTLALFDGGQPKQTVVGLRSKDYFIGMIDKTLD